MNRSLKNSFLVLSLCLMSAAVIAGSTSTAPRLPFPFVSQPQATSSGSSAATSSFTPIFSTLPSSSSGSWFRLPSLPSFSWSTPSRETTTNLLAASLLAGALVGGGYAGWRYYWNRTRPEQGQQAVVPPSVSSSAPGIANPSDRAQRIRELEQKIAETKRQVAESAMAIMIEGVASTRAETQADLEAYERQQERQQAKQAEKQKLGTQTPKTRNRRDFR